MLLPSFLEQPGDLRPLFALCGFAVADDSSSDSDCESDGEGSTCSSSSDSEVFDVIAEIKRKKAHPDRLHEELWYNDPGQVGHPYLAVHTSAASQRLRIH